MKVRIATEAPYIPQILNVHYQPTAVIILAVSAPTTSPSCYKIE